MFFNCYVYCYFGLKRSSVLPCEQRLLSCMAFSFYDRLQNSPYFCVFKYARAVKQKVWNEAENRERDWGEGMRGFAHSFQSQ